MEAQKKLLNVKEAADYLGLCSKTLNNKRCQGYKNLGWKLPFIKLGGAIRYRLSDLDQALNDNTFTHNGEVKAKGGE